MPLSWTIKHRTFAKSLNKRPEIEHNYVESSNGLITTVVMTLLLITSVRTNSTSITNPTKGPDTNDDCKQTCVTLTLGEDLEVSPCLRLDTSLLQSWTRGRDLAGVTSVTFDPDRKWTLRDVSAGVLDGNRVRAFHGRSVWTRVGLVTVLVEDCLVLLKHHNTQHMGCQKLGRNTANSTQLLKIAKDPYETLDKSHAIYFSNIIYL